jgi:AcrR family transcriptional regulator
VKAALRLARKGGERAVSMRGVARALDVDVAALYWHFEDKDSLLQEVEAAAGDSIGLEVPSAGNWRERALSLCATIRAQLLSHPELGIQAGGSMWTTAFIARANGLLVEVLAGSGLTGETLLLAAQGLLHQVTALAQSEGLALSTTREGARRFARQVREHLPDDAETAWQTLSRRPAEESFRTCFELSVGASLDGIALRGAP